LVSSARYTEQLGEQASGVYVYQLKTPSTTITLPPRSTTSIDFFEPQITVDSFLSYSSIFTTFNTKGKLAKTYNITSVDAYVPTGRLVMLEQGRFIGEVDLPDLTIGEIYTVQFSYDADVSYRRRVNMLQGDEDSESVVYGVEIMFENRKPLRDIPIDFTESYSAYKYYEVNNISTTVGDNNEKVVDLVLYGTDLRGHFMLKRQGGQKFIRYEVTVHKTKPLVVVHDQ